MIKELIQHISEEDLEVNITFEIGKTDEAIQQELREIKKILRGDGGTLSDSDKEELRGFIDEEPQPSQENKEKEALEEAEEDTDVAKKDLDYTGFSSEDAEVSKETEEKIKNDLREDLKEQLTEEAEEELEGEESSEEQPAEESSEESEEDMEETFKKRAGIEDESEDDGEFDEVFGTGEEEEEEPDSPPEDEPSEEERSEAGADFEELFG